jgi:hypothetical protein
VLRCGDRYPEKEAPNIIGRVVSCVWVEGVRCRRCVFVCQPSRLWLYLGIDGLLQPLLRADHSP